MGSSQFLTQFVYDILDVLVVAWLFYRLFLIFRQTKAIRVLMGLGGLVLVYFVARLCEFEALLGLVEALTGKRLEFAIVLFVIIFADEIRDTFAGIVWAVSRRSDFQEYSAVVNDVSRACGSMARKGIGALIAIAQENPLDHWEMQDSVAVDGQLSAQLLETIFSGKTPLHDGAVIIRSGKIVAAKCQLPTSKNPEITERNVGMRHRAAFGLSEMSDAIVICVSEERGDLSIAHKGRFYEGLTAEQLKDKLHLLIGPESSRKPWYSPTNLFDNGWLKLVALILAFVIWGEQSATIPLKDQVRVVEKDGVYRIFPLSPQHHVFLDPGMKLESRGIQDREMVYEQVLGEVEYKIVGSNFARLVLLSKVLFKWRESWNQLPRNLAGRVVIEAPEKLLDKTKIENKKEKFTLPLKLVRDEFQWMRNDFTIKDQSISLRIDSLEVLSTEQITVTYYGTPAKGLKVTNPKRISVSPVKKNQLMVLPSSQLETVDFRNSLNPCPTSPKIDVNNESSWDQEVELLVPPELRLWNPEVQFRARVTLVFWSDQMERLAQNELFSENVQREIESQANEAKKRAQNLRLDWLAFERKVESESWQDGLSFDNYKSLRDDTIPDLAKRLERAKAEQKSVIQLKEAETQKLNNVTTSQEREIAEARKNICVVVEQWRTTIVEALKEQQTFLKKKVEAIEKRVRVPLDSLAKAEKQRDELAKQPKIPVPEKTTGAALSTYVNSKGPAVSKKSESSKELSSLIANAALATHARNIYSLVIKDFERWHQASREFETLTQNLRSIEDRIDKSKSLFLLEIELHEKKALRDYYKMQRDRHRKHWSELESRLTELAKELQRDNTLLSHIVESWPEKELKGLDSRPFFELFRNLEVEVSQLLTFRGFIQDQMPRLKVGEADDVTLDDLRGLSNKFWSYQSLFHERLRQVTLILNRLYMLDAKTPSSSVKLLSKKALPALRAQLQTDLKLLDEIVQQTNSINLGQEQTIPKALNSVTASLTSATAVLKTIQLEAKKVDQDLSKALDKNNGAFTPFAARYSLVKLGQYERDEKTLLLDLQKRILEDLKTRVNSRIEPALKTLEQRLQELEKQYEPAVIERIPELKLAETELKSKTWLGLERNNNRLREFLNSTAIVKTETFANCVRKLYIPISAKDLGFNTFAKLYSRFDSSETKLQALKKTITNQEQIRASDMSLDEEVELRFKKRQYELQMADHEALTKVQSRCQDLIDAETLKQLSKQIKDRINPKLARAFKMDSMRTASSLLLAKIGTREKQLEDLKEQVKKANKAEQALLEKQAKLLTGYVEKLREAREQVNKVYETLETERRKPTS